MGVLINIQELANYLYQSPKPKQSLIKFDSQNNHNSAYEAFCPKWLDNNLIQIRGLNLPYSIQSLTVFILFLGATAHTFYLFHQLITKQLVLDITTIIKVSSTLIAYILAFFISKYSQIYLIINATTHKIYEVKPRFFKLKIKELYNRDDSLALIVMTKLTSTSEAYYFEHKLVFIDQNFIPMDLTPMLSNSFKKVISAGETIAKALDIPFFYPEKENQQIELTKNKDSSLTATHYTID